MKKRMTMLTAILLCGAMLAACGGNKKAEETASSAAAEAKSEVTEAESAVSEAESAVSEAESAASEAESAVSEAEETAEEEAEVDLVPDEEAAEAETAESAEEAADTEEAAEAEEEKEVTEEEAEAEEKNSEAAAAMVDEAAKDPILEIPTIDGEYTLEDCVKLGDYKGLKLEMEINEVTEEDIDRYFTYLVQPVEVKEEDAVLEEGDTANLDFTGYLDGEAFSGGAGTDYDLEIGSGTFIPGFEDQMVGMKKGEERDLDLTFPENYSSDELAGQDVVFHVKLNAIKRMPEVDDAWASEYSEGEYATLEEFREATRADLEEQNRSYAETNLQNEAWNAVVESSEILAFPEVLLKEKEDEYASYLESEAQIYGLTAAEYIEQMGMTQEDFDQINEVQVRTEVKNEMLLEAVVKAEGISEDNEEYQAELNRLVENYGMTVDELKETYGEDILDRHLKSLVAINKVLSYADVTEKTAAAE